MPTERSRNINGETTRKNIILAAEKLFGDLGIDAVTLRAIGKQAGQKNNNSVQYHFSSKDTLVQAVLEHREILLQPLRTKLFETAHSNGRLGDIKELLRIMFQPYFHICQGENHVNYLKLSSVYLIQERPKGVTHPVDRNEFKPSETYRTTFKRLRQRCFFMSDWLFTIRIESVAIMFFNAFIQQYGRGALDSPSSEYLLEEILEMMTAAMGAPPVREINELPDVNDGN
jgi:AcrR family transcriptional regulator